MKRVITYGTFDLFHKGHLNILKKSKEQGDYLVVGVTSENYDISRGKLNVSQSLEERIDNVRKTGLADKIIVEEYFGQKIEDIQKYNIDKFVIGSDWEGKFDYLNAFCEVVYVERTKNVSSTELRNEKNKILRLGIVGNGRIAKRFVKESKYVSGISVESVYGRNIRNLEEFNSIFNLTNIFTDYDEFLNSVDAVYIALPHTLHYEYTKKALLKDKHVLCEKPFTLNSAEAKELFELAQNKNLILQEALKTVYSPCFTKLVNIVHSGIIGKVTDVDATFTKLITDKSLREYNADLGGGSISELASYPLGIITKLLGTSPRSVNYIASIDKETNVDIMNKITLLYDNAVATANVGIGVKKEGCCVISGTKGYIYIPAPWWKTEFFEVRFENLNDTQKFFIKFEGDGLRYELADFLKSIIANKKSYKLTDEESIFISSIIGDYIYKKTDKIMYI